MNKNEEEGKECIKDVYQFGELKVLVKGFFVLDNNIKKLYDKIKSTHKDTNIAIVNSKIVFGLDHIFGIIKIINEEMNRKEEREIKNFDIEFLLRICYTNQISYAFQVLNDNKSSSSSSSSFICILFSKSLSNIKNAYTDLKKNGKEGNTNTLIQISEAKKSHILELFFNKDIKDLENIRILNDDNKFQKFLIERSAIALK